MPITIEVDENDLRSILFAKSIISGLRGADEEDIILYLSRLANTGHQDKAICVLQSYAPAVSELRQDQRDALFLDLMVLLDRIEDTCQENTLD